MTMGAMKRETINKPWKTSDFDSRMKMKTSLHCDAHFSPLFTFNLFNFTPREYPFKKCRSLLDTSAMFVCFFCLICCYGIYEVNFKWKWKNSLEIWNEIKIVFALENSFPFFAHSTFIHTFRYGNGWCFYFYFYFGWLSTGNFDGVIKRVLKEIKIKSVVETWLYFRFIVV